MAIVTKYLSDFQNYITEYGIKTVCLIQIGGFYEIISVIRSDPLQQGVLKFVRGRTQ